MTSKFINKVGTSSHDKEDFKRICFAAAVYKSRYILAAGGFNRMGKLKSAKMYDMQTQKLLALPDLPTRIPNCGGVVLNDYFYTVSYDEIYRLSLPSHSEWESVHSRENKEYVDAVISDGKRIFILNRNGEITRYDPNTNECIMMPPMPTPRFYVATTIIGTNIFVIGGLDVHSGEMYSLVEVFDISKQSWRKGTPLPEPLVCASAISFNGRIVVTGGFRERSETSFDAFIFDILNRKWSRKEVELSPRIFHRSVAFGEQRIALVGGNDRGKSYHSIETVERKYLSPSWENIKHFVLLRQLVDESRAVHISQSNEDTKKNDKVNAVVKKLIVDLDSDMFREVLSFLI